MTQQLYVDKVSGTFADQLMAFGLATLAQDMLQRAYDDQRLSVMLRDAGPYYRLELDRLWDDEAIQRVRGPYTPVQAIVTVKNANSFPSDLPEASRVSYEEWKDQNARFWGTFKALPKEAQRSWFSGKPTPEAEVLRALEPHRDWDIFRAINPGALAGYTKLMVWWWRIQSDLGAVLRLLRNLYSVTPNDLATAVTEWKKLDKASGWGIPAFTTAGQLYNPSQGKGQNQTKPDRLSMGNVDGFWLAEWLKAFGFYQAALTKQLRGSKDRKTYVLAPLNLRSNEHDSIFRDFRKTMFFSDTAIRSDVLAVLRYTDVLLEHALGNEGRSLLERLTHVGRLREIVSGFSSAYYKDLGNAVATLNLPFVGLPGWLHVANSADVSAAREVIDEHTRIVSSLDESHSDEYRLLQDYRDFCCGESLDAFFAFVVPYGAHVVAKRERNQYALQFTEENLRRLIMSSDPKLAPILEMEGFRNVAYAIRQSTVTAQYRSKKLGDRRYDVRYGLGQQLARKAHYATDFVAELSDFMQKFNAENAQVMEARPGPYRKSLKTSDIEDIVRLVDEYGSRTICNLLIAYGYARTSSEKGSEDAPDIVPDALANVENDESATEQGEE